MSDITSSAPARGKVSVVVVLQETGAQTESILRWVAREVARVSDEFQIVVVDRASQDDTVEQLETALQTVPNVEVRCLTTELSLDVAFLAGLDAVFLGDCVVLFDPTRDHPDHIARMVQAVLSGADMAVTASPRYIGSPMYRWSSAAFLRAFKFFSGVDPRGSGSRFRAFSRRVLTHIQQADPGSIGQTSIPMLGRFKSVQFVQTEAPAFRDCRPPLFVDGIRRALGMMTSTTVVPLRLATSACALGAMISLLGSLYVVGVNLVSSDVAPGWTTLSLQVSGLFFLLSVAVAMLSEYVLSLRVSGTRQYSVGREFHSREVTRKEKLNLAMADRS